MQKVYLRKTKAATESSDRDSEKILHFSLQDSLPSNHIIALNKAFGTLSYLVCSENSMPRLMRQEQFTNTEMSVLLPMLEMFPYYCPYELLYASFYGGGKATDEHIEDARIHLDNAQVEGVWEQEMRPVRCALSRTRLKIRAFGIDISSILATGYILLIANEPVEEVAEMVGVGPKWKRHLA
jgi:hypothetical protein